MKKKSLLLVLLLVFAIAITACSNANVDESANVEGEEDKAYYTFTDALGNTVVLEEKPERVVSLVGSFADTWVLAGGELIGITDDVVREGRLEITEDMKSVGTIQNPNVEEVLALSPDFVLLSADTEPHIKVAETLTNANIAYAFFKVEYFEDYLSMLDICTDITGNKDLYEENGLKIKEEIEEVIAKVEEHNPEKPTVLYFRAISKGPSVKKDDNNTCHILDDLGAINIASKHPSLLEELSMEVIIEEDPDFILFNTIGSGEKAIEALKNGIEQHPAWSNLSAVKNDRYIMLPQELFHYKPNAKWGESYRYLAEILYPEIFE